MYSKNLLSLQSGLLLPKNTIAKSHPNLIQHVIIHKDYKEQIKFKSKIASLNSSKFKINASSSVEPPPSPVADVFEIKAMLLDSLFGTERGLRARGETKAEINDLIVQLEANNPTPSPTEASEMLCGTWKLVYYSNKNLTNILLLNNLPFFKIGDISQTISDDAKYIENKIEISVPFSKTSFKLDGTLEVKSPKRLGVKFNKGTISTPELLEDIEIPADTTIMGQKIDLKPLRTALAPFQSNIKDAVAQLGSFVSRQPDFTFSLTGNRRDRWILTTYLDHDTRVLRSETGSLYVLIKELTPPSSSPPMKEVIETEEIIEEEEEEGKIVIEPEDVIEEE